MRDMEVQITDNFLAAAVQKRKNIGVEMNFAIVDTVGNQPPAYRTNRAWLGSIDNACKNSQTIRPFNMPTSEVDVLSRPGGTSPKSEQPNKRLFPFPSGIAATNKKGEVIGMSALTVKDNHAIEVDVLKSVTTASA